MRSKKYYVMLFILFSLLNVELCAVSVPETSNLDSRVAYVSFNADNVVKVYANTGFTTVIEFSADEQIINLGCGFADGWDLNQKGNLLFITPKAVSTKFLASDDPNEQNAPAEIMVSPNAKEWRTNLIVTTSASIYVFELNLNAKKAYYKLSFIYPQKELNKLKEVEKIVSQKIEQSRIETALNRTSVPKNWEFYMKVGKNSEAIKPNYAYDDGVFTYLGFDNTKSFPSVFGFDDNKEQILNTHIKKDGDYDVVIIQKTMPHIILRSGDKVVGILNKGYGKNPPKKTQQTSNDNLIKRELKSK